MSGRRQFLRDATSNLAAMAALGAVAPRTSHLNNDEWDLAWPARLTGTQRAVFDATEIESGAGVFRAGLWASQCVGVLGVTRADVSPAIVLRSHAVALALHQGFWDKYSVGRLLRVVHPMTLKETQRNPVLMDESDALPPAILAVGLQKQLASGVVVLACNVALQSWIDAIRQRNGVSDAEARQEAVGALVTGVILQPSGVLAAYLAQKHGCAYIHAS
jgi:hypothetical protein